MLSVLIGRHPECGIVINDPTVSRQHATIVEIEPGHYLIKDEKSSCGTFVMQSAAWSKVSTARVSEADPIRLGAYETTIKHLLKDVHGGSRQPSRIVERDPETGQIIVRTT